VDEDTGRQLREMSYVDLRPHKALLDAGMLGDTTRLDDGANAVLKAYLASPVAIADLPPELAGHVRQQVGCAIRRYITDR